MATRWLAFRGGSLSKGYLSFTVSSFSAKSMNDKPAIYALAQMLDNVDLAGTTETSFVQISWYSRVGVWPVFFVSTNYRLG